MNPLWRAGALALVLLSGGLLALSCGSSTPSSPSGGAADVMITINGINGTMSFSPASATLKVGQTVAWRNADSITHAPIQDTGVFDVGDVPGGSTSAAIKMGTAGTFGYHCAIHPVMVGSLTVNP
jgi:plastocyanin